MFRALSDSTVIPFSWQYEIAPISLTGQERGCSCPTSEKVHDKSTGSGQGPAAAPFGNNSVSRSKGRNHSLPWDACLSQRGEERVWVSGKALYLKPSCLG